MSESPQPTSLIQNIIDLILKGQKIEFNTKFLFESARDGTSRDMTNPTGTPDKPKIIECATKALATANIDAKAKQALEGLLAQIAELDKVPSGAAADPNGQNQGPAKVATPA